MMEMALDKAFWDTLWKNNLTGWDLKKVSPPIKDYFDKIEDKNLAILIPGCGNAYEAKYLMESGFTNVTIIDIAPTVVSSIIKELDVFIGKQLNVVCGDFFKHTGKYDLIIATGVLYPQYNAKEILDIIKTHASGTILLSNIADWEVKDVEELGVPLLVEEYPYREYTQRLRIYEVGS